MLSDQAYLPGAEPTNTPERFNWYRCPSIWHGSDCEWFCSRQSREGKVPLYRLNIYNDDVTADLEGRRFPNLRAAVDEAVKGARALMADEICSKGRICLSHWIEVEDELGEVTVVSFRDAVTVVP